MLLFRLISHTCWFSRDWEQALRILSYFFFLSKKVEKNLDNVICTRERKIRATSRRRHIITRITIGFDFCATSTITTLACFHSKRDSFKGQSLEGKHTRVCVCCFFFFSFANPSTKITETLLSPGPFFSLRTYTSVSRQDHVSKSA